MRAIDEILSKHAANLSNLILTIHHEEVVQDKHHTLLNRWSEAMRSGPDPVGAGVCSQNSTMYEVRAAVLRRRDGVLGFMSGAAFRMGAESEAEFGRSWRPARNTANCWNTIFYSKDVGRPVRFIPPSFALDDITQIRASAASARTTCRLWWIEYGGGWTPSTTRAHQVGAVEDRYGVWNYIKNSGEFPEAETLTLEW